ncbi:MAG: ABC transporter substrate-binding protein, partial [Acetobacteraceae bacterium]
MRLQQVPRRADITGFWETFMTAVSSRWLTGCATTALAAMAAVTMTPARADDTGPIKIGVVSEFSAVVGEPIAKGAQLAADAVNAKGGITGRKVEIVAYDDHASAADAVRAFQRLAEQDHVAAVVTTFISEVALAEEPWAARLHMPTATPGAASDLITKQVHDKYDQYKYMFEVALNSPLLALGVCDSSHDLLADGLHMKTAAIVREDADWTKPYAATLEKCLPEAGLTIVDQVVFNPDTTDFTPIFNKVEAKHPDVMIMGIAHVGVQPTVQWHSQQVPIPMAGLNVVDQVAFNPDTTDFTPIFNGVEAKHPDVMVMGIAHVGVQPTVQLHSQQVPIPMAGISAQASNDTF